MTIFAQSSKNVHALWTVRTATYLSHLANRVYPRLLTDTEIGSEMGTIGRDLGYSRHAIGVSRDTRAYA